MGLPRPARCGHCLVSLRRQAHSCSAAVWRLCHSFTAVSCAIFIGYLVAGAVGSSAAALAVFAPPFFIVILAAPYYRRFAQNPHVNAFVKGVTAAAVGAIAGAAVVLGRRAIVDWQTGLIALITFVGLLVTKKIPEPLLIIGAGVLGLAIQRGTH